MESSLIQESPTVNLKWGFYFIAPFLTKLILKESKIVKEKQKKKVVSNNKKCTINQYSDA